MRIRQSAPKLKQRGYLYASRAAVVGAVARRRTGGGGPPPVDDPYPHDPTLDLSEFEWHVGAGYWGAQNTIKVVAEPQGSLTPITISNFGEIEAAAGVSQEWNLDADIDAGDSQIEVDMTDVRINLNGFKLKNLRFGSIIGTNQGNRVEIVGPGQIHHLDFCNVNDLQVRDLDGSGPGENGFSIIVREFNGGTSRRFAATNCRYNAGGYFYIGDAWDTFFRNVSARTGSDMVDPAEAWGIRIAHLAGGNHVFSNVDLRINPDRTDPNAHHNWRIHPNAAIRYVALHDCTMVHFPSSQSVLSNAEFGGGTQGLNIDWMFIKRLHIYNQSGYPNFAIGDCNGVTIEDLDVHSDIWDDDSFINFNPDPGNCTPVPAENRNVSGSTYGPAVAEPAWTGGGNADLVDFTP